MPDDDQKAHRQRLRARMAEGGADAFLDYELLEYLLTFAKRRGDTKPEAKALIREFGTFGSVLVATHDELTRVKGVGAESVAAIKFVEAAATRLLRGEVMGRSVLRNWTAVEDYLTAAMAHRGREQFRVLALDAKNVLIRDELMSEGTVNQAAVHVREVVKLALEVHASALILVHNHPSGDSTPSRDDIRMTELIRDACKPLEIAVHDHIIVGKNGNTSLRAQGLI